MHRWTLRNLITEPWQLLASVCAVGGALALVVFFEAVFAGESKQIVAYIEESGADVWVMQKGVSNMHMTTSFVPDWKADRIREVPGVAEVTPILYLNTVMQAGDRNWFSFVVGLEKDAPRAGPWSAVEGSALPGPGEAVVPAVLARLIGLKLGDGVAIGGHPFTVAGLSEGTFSMANSVTFVSMPDLEDIMSTFGSFSYFLVDASPGVDAVTLASRIRSEVDKVNAIPARTFAANDSDVAMQMGLDIIGVMNVIGGALAILLTAFTVYSATSRKQRELAVMKALGVRNRAIYLAVALHAAVLALLGVLAGVGLVLAAGPVTAAFVPQVTLHVTGEAVIRVGLTAFVVAVVAAIVPARRIVQVDPVSAFKE